MPQEQWEKIEIEKILDKIIADEDNSEMNVAYYKKVYTEKFMKIVSSTRTEERERIAEIIKNQPDLYTTDIFRKPWDGWEKDVHELAKSKGFAIDNISAYYGRMMRKNLQDSLLSALQEEK